MVVSTHSWMFSWVRTRGVDTRPWEPGALSLERGSHASGPRPAWAWLVASVGAQYFIHLFMSFHKHWSRGIDVLQAIFLAAKLVGIQSVNLVTAWRLGIWLVTRWGLPSGWRPRRAAFVSHGLPGRPQGSIGRRRPSIPTWTGLPLADKQLVRPQETALSTWAVYCG